MKIDELINELQVLREKKGNVEVMFEHPYENSLFSVDLAKFCIVKTDDRYRKIFKMRKGYKFVRLGGY